MLIYNVTIKIAPAIHTEWLSWMQTTHVPDVMQTGLFESYRLCLLDKIETEEEEITYVFQYLCSSREKLNTYFDNHAAALREDVIKKFGNQFIAFRTVMEIVA